MSTTILEQPKVHPRRRAVGSTVPPSLPSLSIDQAASSTPPSPSYRPNGSLKKGATFHSPLSPPREDQDPILNVPSLPPRCPTDTKSLEAIAASEQRRAEILDHFDLSALSSCITDVQATDDNPSHRRLTLPNIRVGEGTPCEEDSGSDSGLGSSVSSTDYPKVGHLTLTGVPDKLTSVLGTKPTTSDFTSMSMGKSNPHHHTLVENARKSIERIILHPILKEEKLKPFHSLVQTIPKRIVNNEIICLRDLEKTLLWLAPAFSASSASFFRFCNFTIQAIHTTVPHLSERDLVRPNDRPYTNGYFLDLVTQIRQYAASVASAREQARARGEETPKQNKERITLVGGLAESGHPAELVRQGEDGKEISLRTGEVYEESSVPTMKRALSNLSVDEGVERSMARRKKNAPPMNINQKCRDCDKVFKRPCDLTKHEKTHSRPWKCCEPNCKYFEIGWPTEKERDRHVNDRHAKTPQLYKCAFPPCTYQSKRESNCKQHMEKAHGWEYKRSKNNGKISMRTESVSSISNPALPSVPPSASMSAQLSPPTPAMPTPNSYFTDLSTPGSGPLPSPNDPFLGSYEDQPFNFNDPPMVNAPDFTLYSSSVLDDTTFGMAPFHDFPMDCDFTVLDMFQTQEFVDNNFWMPKMEDMMPGL